MKVLVTGATGFVGQALCFSLVKHGCQIRSVTRVDSDYFLNKENRKSANTNDFVAVGAIGPYTDWSHALQGVNTIVHLAARVHVMQDNAVDPLAAFREVNTLGTERLAREAAKVGVRRFVYLSSIKVNGEETELRTENLGLSRKKSNIGF